MLPRDPAKQANPAKQAAVAAPAAAETVVVASGAQLDAALQELHAADAASVAAAAALVATVAANANEEPIEVPPIAQPTPPLPNAASATAAAAAMSSDASAAVAATAQESSSASASTSGQADEMPALSADDITLPRVEIHVDSSAATTSAAASSTTTTVVRREAKVVDGETPAVHRTTPLDGSSRAPADAADQRPLPDDASLASVASQKSTSAVSMHEVKDGVERMTLTAADSGTGDRRLLPDGSLLDENTVVPSNRWQSALDTTTSVVRYAAGAALTASFVAGPAPLLAKLNNRTPEIMFLSAIPVAAFIRGRFAKALGALQNQQDYMLGLRQQGGGSVGRGLVEEARRFTAETFMAAAPAGVYLAVANNHYASIHFNNIPLNPTAFLTFVVLPGAAAFTYAANKMLFNQGPENRNNLLPPREEDTGMRRRQAFFHGLNPFLYGWFTGDLVKANLAAAKLFGNYIKWVNSLSSPAVRLFFHPAMFAAFAQMFHNGLATVAHPNGLDSLPFVDTLRRRAAEQDEDNDDGYEILGDNKAAHDEALTSKLEAGATTRGPAASVASATDLEKVDGDEVVTPAAALPPSTRGQRAAALAVDGALIPAAAALVAVSSMYAVQRASAAMFGETPDYQKSMQQQMMEAATVSLAFSTAHDLLGVAVDRFYGNVANGANRVWNATGDALDALGRGASRVRNAVSNCSLPSCGFWRRSAPATAAPSNVSDLKVPLANTSPRSGR